MSSILRFKIKSKAQLRHIFRAEEELHKANIQFDTGSSLCDGKAITRDWKLDFFTGAELIVKPSKRGEPSAGA